jgi:hypothetical protein
MGVPVPTVTGGLCIHVTPEHCHAYIVRCDETVFESFLYVNEVSKSIIGDRLVHQEEV